MVRVLPPPIQSHAEGPSRGPADDGPADPTVLVAPSAFKGTLTARAAAEAMAAGVRDAIPDARCRLRPVADGGDGSLDALEAAGFERRRARTRGPTGEPVASSIAVRGKVAVVELAASCGLVLLPGGALQPMRSSSTGLGDAIVAALDTGAIELVVCIGGSASTDGGTGMLQALGARLLDDAGRELRASGEALAAIRDLDLSELDPRLRGIRVTVATDVTSPLLGPAGAARVFAPQKGASQTQVAALEAGLASWAGLLARATGTAVADVAGAGAAGGVGAACIAALGARVVSGAGFILDAIDLDGAAAGADLVLTGEGRLDEQSGLGKGTGAVARVASRRGIPVVAVCGQVALDARAIGDLGLASAIALTQAPVVPGTTPDAVGQVRAATATAVAQWRDARRG